jgi:hypothetical protein
MGMKIAQTKDEFGADRFFLEDENADWVHGPYDSREETVAALKAYNAGEEIPES